MKDKLHSVQALRALAAVVVIALHMSLEVGFRGWSRHVSQVFEGWGNFGVDVFFVISGVIMIVTTGNVTPSRASAAAFLKARLIRIVPLYWLCSTVMVMMLVLLHTQFAHNRLDPAHAVCSYLFLPCENRYTGHWFPVLPTGWTLVYEMWFYLTFACALLVTRRRAEAVAIFFLCSTALGFLWSGGLAFRTYTNPLMLEFVAGCCIGELYRRGTMLSKKLSAVLFVLGAGLMIATNPITVGDHERVVFWGIPAALLVAGALFLERAGAWRSARLVETIGDASYSLYLTHVLLMYALSVIARKLDSSMRLPGDAVWAAFVVAAVVLGVITYRYVELPIQHWLRRRASPSAVGGIAAKKRPS
ncbi:acyltransferase family protein [Caballeronia insecticola]|uniref:acyltransferase family protein n=1 Tax=Caballeronia insecticola TaxID=758793 RepID=UPI000685E00B|nr:acyltransferase [Caballeronia insecticola]